MHKLHHNGLSDLYLSLFLTLIQQSFELHHPLFASIQELTTLTVLKTITLVFGYGIC